MTASSDPHLRNRSKVRRHGSLPAELWLPDMRQSGFAENARRQSLVLRDDPHEQVVIEWLEAVADDSGWQD